MSKFAAYNIDLKALEKGTHTYAFTLDDDYFAKIDSVEVQRGNVAATVCVNVNAAGFEVKLDVEGAVVVACDRCLDDMHLPIASQDTMRIKLGDELTDEGDILVLPERDPVLNVAWFLYELVALSIPIKHVHAPGDCNQEMAAKLRHHIAVNLDEEDDDDDEDSLLYTDDED